LKPILPVPVDWKQMGMGQNAFQLVSVEGVLMMRARKASQDEYVLKADDHVFSAILRHPSHVSATELPPMKEITLGSRVRVTGISMFYSSDPFNGPIVSDLLLRSFDDVAVVAPPPWITTRNLLRLIAGLLVVVLIISARGWSLERKIRRQAAGIAARADAEAEIERRRSLILEEINGNGSFSEILEQIEDLVSFRMGGSPCWCETKDGESIGRGRPEDVPINCVSEELRTGSGTILGSIFMSLNSAATANPDQIKALSMGARLASLAMETRRLYTDLVHRSEFDLLTDAHNRFSLEKQLEFQIKSAEDANGIFGLVYFDLDGFKQVNDILGHSAGDQYLQEVTVRVKRQLRTRDILGRLGGDEFAALLPDVHCRADVEEVVGRLEASLEEPILLGNKALTPSVSFGIALYPEDGATKDSILIAADAAMYVVKQRRHAAAVLPIR
jgi:diguanylate cyclase (GGDEF)-like protein